MKKVAICGVLLEKIVRSKFDSEKGNFELLNVMALPYKSVICKIDDGTGVVDCIKFLNSPDDRTSIGQLSVGDMVAALGSVFVQNK